MGSWPVTTVRWRRRRGNPFGSQRCEP